jgi:hypothetical protein
MIFPGRIAFYRDGDTISAADGKRLHFVRNGVAYLDDRPVMHQFGDWWNGVDGRPIGFERFGVDMGTTSRPQPRAPRSTPRRRSCRNLRLS